jgi:tetratricopeptide (TPR) repeat protein
VSPDIFQFYIERGGKPPVTDHHPEFFTRHLLSRVSAAFNNIGILFQSRGKFEDARRYFGKALLREPDLPQAWNNLGINFYLQGDYASAENVFGRGTRKAREVQSLFYYLALSQRRLGKRLEAKKSLEESLKLKPGNPDALNEMGLIFLDEKNLIGARAWFDKCLETRPDYPAAHYNLGLVYRGLGLTGESEKSFRRYLELSR